MLQLTIPATEQWDEKNECFISTKEQTLQLEHSLVAVSKWESKWKKSFFANDQKNLEETIDYIKCMTITQNVNPDVYRCISKETIGVINAYISDPMTATTFPKRGASKSSSETMTSELIYYWMVAFNIPMECQKWHLNRLMTLIKICDVKNQKPKNQSMKERMTSNAALNAARRKQYHTKG